MLTSKELFHTDFTHAYVRTNAMEATYSNVEEQSKIGRMPIECRLILDFLAGVKYLALYISEPEHIHFLPHIGITLDTMLNPKGGHLSLADVPVGTELKLHNSKENRYELELREPGAIKMDFSEFPFSGKVIVYTEFDIATRVQQQITTKLRPEGFLMQYRGGSYAKAKAMNPVAFISHDSRDKEKIARNIASGLRSRKQSIWYDEYSLKPGDSLRESIEDGLKDSKYCILILTPNFLTKGGWVKREYDSIFTRELIEDKKVIIPVWHNVTAKDIYAFSPILADRVAVMWREDDDTVFDELLRALVR